MWRALDLDELSLVVGTVLQEPDKQLVSSSVDDDAFGPKNIGLQAFGGGASYLPEV